MCGVCVFVYVYVSACMCVRLYTSPYCPIRELGHFPSDFSERHGAALSGGGLVEGKKETEEGKGEVKCVN